MKILTDKAYKEAIAAEYERGHKAGVTELYPIHIEHGVEIRPIKTEVTHTWVEIPKEGR